jgi:SAM-dependent methyltransferase
VRVLDAEALTGSNLVYREPALYDELLADDSIATDLMNVIRQHGTRPTTVLDLGCGTGRLLAELHDHGMPGTGIDLQPLLITWARRTHPQLGLHVGDLRTARLGTTFDLVTCVGNTLSYLHTGTELAAAFDTMRAHSHPGTLLALATLTGAGRDVHGRGEVATSLGAATVTTASTWDPKTQIQTTTRTWQFTTGRVEQDTMRRRFWNPGVLAQLADAAGFEVVPANTSSLSLCALSP